MTASEFSFASEIKVFHAFHDDLDLDVGSAFAYFHLQYIPEPHTIYSTVKKVSPGTALVIDTEQWVSKEVPYWHSMSSGPDGEEEFEHALVRSVRYSLIADVKVGVLLSGGIDSTLIAALARESSDECEAFTVGFGNRQLDETTYARLVADALGMKLTEVPGASVDAEEFGRMIFHLDEPVVADRGDRAETYLLGKALAPYVKVSVVGEKAPTNCFLDMSTAGGSSSLSRWYGVLRAVRSLGDWVAGLFWTP